MNEEPRKKRILVVDDDSNVTTYLTKVLSGHGFEAWPVNDPLNVLRRAAEFHPDLVILDFIMPQLLGSEVAVQLKSYKTTQNVPVIFLSGMTDEDHRLIATFSGAAAYLEKPIDPRKLIEAIRTQLGP